MGPLDTGTSSPHEDTTDASGLTMASCCDGEDWCTVLCTAERLSRKWHPVIIHRLLEQGPMGFTALENSVTGLSSKVLSESLEVLEGYGIIHRDVLSESPRRVHYHLTSSGQDLAPIVHAMQEWGRRHLPVQ